MLGLSFLAAGPHGHDCWGGSVAKSCCPSVKVEESLVSSGYWILMKLLLSTYFLSVKVPCSQDLPCFNAVICPVAGSLLIWCRPGWLCIAWKNFELELLDFVSQNIIVTAIKSIGISKSLYIRSWYKTSLFRLLCSGRPFAMLTNDFLLCFQPNGSAGQEKLKRYRRKRASIPAWLLLRRRLTNIWFPCIRKSS